MLQPVNSIVVLSGAGISAESGISTFRDAGGLWEGHDIMEVATPEGWQRNPALVLHFYNKRREQLHQVAPNPAHLALADLESRYSVTIVTQNVDDLHERAGSSRVIHLHGELRKARSTGDPTLVYDWPGPITREDRCDKGFPLRPHIVWFGEAVPLLDQAAEEVANADLLLIVGTSLVVYPAAGLCHHARPGVPIHYVDPHPGSMVGALPGNFIVHPHKASTGVTALVREWLAL
jgi:NAD-dependent deacetylase